MNNSSWWRHGPAETPEDEAEAAVWIQTDGHFSGRVQLTLQLHRPAEGPNCIMGHLEGGRERQKDTTRHTNRRTENRVERWTVNLKIQTEESSVSVSWQLDLSDSVCVFHFYSLLVVVLYTKPGCAQSFAPYLNKYIFLHLLFGVYLRHWYLKRSSEVCLPASRLQPLNELHSVDCCCSDGWISLRNEKKVLNKWNKE